MVEKHFNTNMEIFTSCAKTIQSIFTSLQFSIRVIIVIISLTVSVLLGACTPSVPHEIVSDTDDSCRSCHQNGENDAPAVKHFKRDNCLSCHEGSSKASEESAQLNFPK